MKKVYIVLLTSVLLLLFGTLTVFATDDTVAPEFDPHIQTMYLLQRKDDGSAFVPEDIITDIKATDNIDGNNVQINLEYNNVDLSQDGQYQLLYTATDKAGNSSSIIIVVIVDGMGPVFDENEETTYYINQEGIIFDSDHNIVDSLPETINTTDSMGAYRGIGIYISSDENGNVIVIDTIKNTPAHNLLNANDIIIALDGEDVRAQSPEYVASKIKGSDTENVELKVVRNGQELSLTIQKDLIKLYDDEVFIASPDIEIASINKNEPGKIEITYTATDAAGNTTEFVVTIIVMDEVEDDSDKIIEDDEDEESEETEDITAGDNPPKDINIEFPDDTEIIEEESNEITSVEDSEKIIEDIIEE